jgi:dTDP-4-amino-4,6-dideoxygalactose transaminase
MEPIIEIARARDVRVIEDCSHAHGAAMRGRKVGRFADAAVFSTMFSKTLATGGCGGLIYTEDEELYWRIRAHADRGKDFRRPDFNDKDPRQFLFPAGNYNQDELSCAIGLCVLRRLPGIIERRREVVREIDAALTASDVVTTASPPPGSDASPFYHTAIVDAERITVSKQEFAEAVEAEGAWINPHNLEVVCEWPWIQPYLKGSAKTPEAVAFRDRTFSILLHEAFGDAQVQAIAECILKVERFFRK